MRKIILMMPVSAGGFIEGPEREPDWHKAGDELHRHFSEQVGAMGAFLMGRVTGELIAGVWPALGSRETWPVRGPAGQLRAGWPQCRLAAWPFPLTYSPATAGTALARGKITRLGLAS